MKRDEYEENEKAIKNMNRNLKFLEKDFNSVKDFLKTTSIDVGTSRIDHDEDAIRYTQPGGYFITDNILSFFRRTPPGPKVLYKLNKDGFRSKNFEPYKNDQLNVLVSGCSLTFGEGVPEEVSWPSMLQSELSEVSNKDVVLYNLGYPAASIQLIIKNTISFINKYGKPKFLFMLLPNIDRGLIFDKSKKKYVTAIPGYFQPKEDKRREESKVYIDFSENYEISDILLHVSIQINLLESFCNEAGILFKWSTWNEDSQKIFKELGFKNFLEWDLDYFSKVKNTKDLPYWEYGNDGVHFGSSFSTYASKLFLNSIPREHYHEDI
jgi:hypothetical protein